MDPRSKKVCRYWLQGRCTRWSSCPFLHGNNQNPQGDHLRGVPPSRIWSRNANAFSTAAPSVGNVAMEITNSGGRCLGDAACLCCGTINANASTAPLEAALDSSSGSCSPINHHLRKPNTTPNSNAPPLEAASDSSWPKNRHLRKPNPTPNSNAAPLEAALDSSWPKNHHLRKPNPTPRSNAAPLEAAPDSSWPKNHHLRKPNPTPRGNAAPLEAAPDSSGPKSCHLRKPNPTPNSNAAPLEAQAAAAAAGATVEKQNYICDFFLRGMECGYGDKCRYLHAWCTSPRGDLSFVAQLQGHQKVIRGIALPENSNKLFSASKDGNVRVWDCLSGQCIADANLGDEVGCLVGEGPLVFAGISNAVKAWNLQLPAELALNGPNGQVCSLVVGLDYLFSGVEDGTITVWKISADNNSFHLARSLTGHQSAVISLVVGQTRLYSSSMDTTIKVWDIATLQCLQTLTNHTEAVTSLLCWDQFLLSCSLDETIKVWVSAESGKLEVVYAHKEEQGILRLNVLHDMQHKPILLYSCTDNTVKLVELPSFEERGKIFSKQEVRVIETGPSGLLFTGDGLGDLKVWKFN